MMSASEDGKGGHGKADVVREVAYKSVPNSDEGKGDTKSENFVNIIAGNPLTVTIWRSDTSNNRS